MALMNSYEVTRTFFKERRETYKKRPYIRLALEDFNRPVGLSMKQGNRWVQKTAPIPTKGRAIVTTPIQSPPASKLKTRKPMSLPKKLGYAIALLRVVHSQAF